MEYMFIVNLSGDINVDTTFYKLSQTWTWLISWKARSSIFCDQKEESALHILNIVCLQGSSGTICSLLLVVLLQGAVSELCRVEEKSESNGRETFQLRL